MALQVTSLFLLSIAANFDKVAVLCHKEGCDGMLDRWPKDFQDRVHIFDGAQIDPMYTNQVGEQRKDKQPRQFFVTMSHVHVAQTLFAKNDTSSYLFLEEDYEVVQPKTRSRMFLNESASNIARFVEKNTSWQFLRLGYNPVWQAKPKAARCKAACLCQSVHKGICSITAGKFSKKSTCWIRSTVGYAVHRRAWNALQKLGNCTMDKFNLSIDNWLPGYTSNCTNRSPVHYLIPGVIHQNITRQRSKTHHAKAMEGFSSKCATSYKYSLPRNTSTGQSANDRNETDSIQVH
jgi:hypothetical protein